jgi:hypothetical protein
MPTNRCPLMTGSPHVMLGHHADPEAPSPIGAARFRVDSPGTTALVTSAHQGKVAATGVWRDEEGQRLPAGEVHAWEPGQNQTRCGLALSRSALSRFPHVVWADVQPATGGAADAVSHVCRRCAAAEGRRRGDRGWKRALPRP